MIFNIQIAEHVFKIVSLHDSVFHLCQHYLSIQPAEHTVEIHDWDIVSERYRTPIRYSDEDVEETAVYRKICEYLALQDTILFHSSAIAVDGNAFLFAAPSGTGKSTHVRLWKSHFGDRAVILNDDKPLITVKSGRATAYGTPWAGKEDLNTNTHFPIRSICFLERGAQNRIQELQKENVFPLLLDQTYRPESPESYAAVLKTLGCLSSSVRFYRLACNMDPEAALVAYQCMKP